MTHKIMDWKEKVPIYKNGSKAIPKGEPVIQVSAIESLLLLERNAWVEKIQELYVDESFNSSWHRENAHGYNEALSDVISALQEDKNI